MAFRAAAETMALCRVAGDCAIDEIATGHPALYW